jgi:hypothetical protein
MGRYWMGWDQIGSDADGMGWDVMGKYWMGRNYSKVRRDAFFTLHIIHVGIIGMS